MVGVTGAPATDGITLLPVDPLAPLSSDGDSIVRYVSRMLDSANEAATHTTGVSVSINRTMTPEK